MKFHDYLTEQINRHPSMEPQDVVKMCYQAAFGPEHLLTDPDRAKAYFDSEYASVPPKETELFEKISPEVCRINLCAWKQAGLPAEWLFRMFADSAKVSRGSRELFLEYLNMAEQAVERGKAGFGLNPWKDFLARYTEAGMPPVHHSQVYGEKEYPAYRIVSSRFLGILPVLQQASCLSKRNAPKIIAVDGPAASGKSTMAELLETVLKAGVIHMDDFFVPPGLRSEERFRQPGGNVHYERFIQEVLPCIGKPEPFSYEIFDCGTMDYQGYREVKKSDWRVVEGSYSTHPAFGDYADLRVFLCIDREEQMRRIVARNGEETAKVFAGRWIPLEDAYFEKFRIREKADIVTDSTN